jgi:hypothetical protein
VRQSEGTPLESKALPCLSHLDACISAPYLTAAAEAAGGGQTSGRLSAADLPALPPLLLAVPDAEALFLHTERSAGGVVHVLRLTAASKELTAVPRA